MRITRRQLRKTLRRVLAESMKDLYGEIQNEILLIGQELGGELTVMDAVEGLKNFPADPSDPTDPRSTYARGLPYDEVLQIMFDMVESGILVGGYEDFFDVHPDYM